MGNTTLLASSDTREGEYESGTNWQKNIVSK